MPDLKSVSLKLLCTLSLVILLICLAPNAFARSWWQIRVKNIPLEAEIVESSAEQQMGLGNRFSLPEGQSMLFLYNTPDRRIFWMKRMNFPIDIVWFQNGKAVKIEENVPFPAKDTGDDFLPRYGYGVLADMVLELPAGFTRKKGISVGDSLEIVKKD